MTTYTDVFETRPAGLPQGIMESASEPLKILLAEDDAGDAFLIKKALRQNPSVGFVEHAKDGIEALEMLEHGSTPDLAIVDLHMPRKNGFDLLLNLSLQESIHFPVIVLTSSKGREDATRSRMRGANSVYTKPNTFGELDVLLSRVIADLQAA